MSIPNLPAGTRGYHNATISLPPSTTWIITLLSWIPHPKRWELPPKPGCQSPLTTRILPFLVENPHKPLFVFICDWHPGARGVDLTRKVVLYLTEAPGPASPGGMKLWEAKALKNFMESAFPTVTLASKQNSEFWAGTYLTWIGVWMSQISNQKLIDLIVSWCFSDLWPTLKPLRSSNKNCGEFKIRESYSRVGGTLRSPNVHRPNTGYQTHSKGILLPKEPKHFKLRIYNCPGSHGENQIQEDTQTTASSH